MSLALHSKLWGPAGSGLCVTATFPYSPAPVSIHRPALCRVHALTTFPPLSHHFPALDSLECALMTVSNCSGRLTVREKLSHTELLSHDFGPFSCVLQSPCWCFIVVTVVFTGPLALLNLHDTHICCRFKHRWPLLMWPMHILAIAD